MKYILLIGGAALLGYYFWQKSKKPCGCAGQAAIIPVNTDHATPPAASPIAPVPSGIAMYDAREVGGVFPAQTTISTVSEPHLANVTLQ